MELLINLQKIEKKILSFQFENGLVDLFIGILFSGFAINVILGGSNYMFIPIFCVFTVLFIFVRKFITSPRMGVVKLGKSGKRKELFVWIIIAFSIIFNVIFEYMTRYGYYAGTRNMLSTHIIFATKVMIVLVLTAYFINFKRLYAYGIFIAIMLPISKILENKDIITDYREVFLILGLLITIIGLVQFIRFIKKYPLPAKEVQ